MKKYVLTIEITESEDGLHWHTNGEGELNEHIMQHLVVALDIKKDDCLEQLRQNLNKSKT